MFTHIFCFITYYVVFPLSLGSFIIKVEEGPERQEKDKYQSTAFCQTICVCVDCVCFPVIFYCSL